MISAGGKKREILPTRKARRLRALEQKARMLSGQVMVRLKDSRLDYGSKKLKSPTGVWGVGFGAGLAIEAPCPPIYKPILQFWTITNQNPIRPTEVDLQ